MKHKNITDAIRRMPGSKKFKREFRLTFKQTRCMDLYDGDPVTLKKEKQ